MAKKISIKRIGGLLRLFCLFIILLFILILLWLGLVGFPKPLLREIESVAAQQGIYLKLDKATLKISRGLGVKLHEVHIYGTEQKDSPALISVPYLDLGVELGDLIVGKIQPQHLLLRDAQLRIPLPSTQKEAASEQGGGDHFTISGIHLLVNHAGGELLNFSEGRILFDQIPLRIEGSMSDARFQEYIAGSESDTPSTGKIDLAGELSSLGETMLEVRKWLDSQQWAQGEVPQLSVSFKIDKEIQCHLEAQLPALRYEQFRFKETLLSVSYTDDLVTINKLSTKSLVPDGDLVVQGAYDLKQRSISFDINSNLALIHFARELMKKEDVAVLTMLPSLHRSSNSLQLQGRVSLDEKDNLRDLSLRGHIEQRDVDFRGMLFDEVKAIFSYASGSFSLDELALKLPEGSITAQGFLRNGTGKIQLNLHLLEEDLCGFINTFAPGTLSTSFSKDLDLQGHLDVALRADISTPNFRPGKSPLIDFVPDLRHAVLGVTLPEVTYTLGEVSVHAHQPSISVELNGLNGVGGTRPDLAELFKVSLKAGKLTFKDGKDSYTVDQYMTELQSKGIRWAQGVDIKELVIGHSSLFTYLGKVQVPGIAVDNVNLNLHNIDHIRPLAATESIIEAGLLELQTGALDIYKRRAESLSITMNLKDRSHITGGLKLIWDKAHSSELEIDWKDWQQLHIFNINARLPAKQLMAELPAKVYDDYGVALSKDILIEDGRIYLTTKDAEFKLQSGSLRIAAEGILRKATEIKSLGNSPEELSLTGAVSFEVNGEGDFLYSVTPLKISHKSGILELDVKGNSSSHVHVKGRNTIGLQYINKLINLYDAHAIIRDFKVDSRSRLSMENIDATVTYENGLRIHATTGLNMTNSGYAVGGIIAETDSKGKPTGKERIDTSVQSDPFGYFNRIAAQIEVDISDKVKGERDRMLVIISDAIIDFNNKPWFERMKKTRGKAETRMTGERITLDLNEGYVRIQGLEGQSYPAYAFGMFFAPLYSILVDLDVTEPVDAKTIDSLFPIYTDCKRSMYSTLEVASPHRAHYDFAGIKIPLERLHGFVRISDDYVQLDRFTSYTWEGKLDLNLRVGIKGDKTSLDGYVKAMNMNLKEIAGTFGAEISPALCFADFRFRSPSTEVKDIDGYGQLYLRQGELMELGIFSPISELIYNLPSYIMFFKEEAEEAKRGAISKLSYAITDAIGKSIKDTGKILGTTTDKVPGVNYLLNYSLSDAHADFRIKDGLLSTENFVASGSNLRVPLTGHMNLETLAIKMKLWPDLGSILSLALSPITTISEHIISIELTGKIDDIGWRIGANSPMKMLKSASDKLRFQKKR